MLFFPFPIFYVTATLDILLRELKFSNYSNKTSESYRSPIAWRNRGLDKCSRCKAQDRTRLQWFMKVRWEMHSCILGLDGCSCCLVFICNVWICGDKAHMGIQKWMSASQHSCACFSMALITAVYSVPPKENHLDAALTQIQAAFGRLAPLRIPMMIWSSLSRQAQPPKLLTIAGFAVEPWLHHPGSSSEPRSRFRHLLYNQP